VRATQVEDAVVLLHDAFELSTLKGA
jgi:hypothetical protein